ncbi:MAG TPA: PPC domain-containing protein, partial [Humisphaera sp.]|nr:PPC domain-containing protein [Humisphaera sp.]
MTHNSRNLRRRERETWFIEALESRVLLTAITSGQTISASISAHGESDAYSFNASAGDSISAAMTVLNNAFDPEMDLYGPDGALLQSHYNSAYYGGTTIDLTNAPLTGTYSLVARDRGGDNTGSYGITMAHFGPGVSQSADGDAGPIVSGLTRSAVINAGDLDVFTFSASAGDSISAAMTVLNNAFDPEMDLYGPDGALLQGHYNSAYYGGTTIDLTNAPLTGTYSLVARDRGGDNTG